MADSLYRRTLNSANKNKTHCPQGHPYDEQNTYVYGNENYRGRFCRACAKGREWQRAQWKQNNLARVQAGQRRRLYGLTEEGWAQKLAEQEGLCAVCRTQAATNVDHNHETKKIRGLLCRECNLELGRIERNPALIIALFAYIELWRQRHAS